jgi:hypothetical protein
MQGLPAPFLSIGVWKTRAILGIEITGFLTKPRIFFAPVSDQEQGIFQNKTEYLMAEQSVVHIYPSLEEAEAAVKHLGDSKFPINQISIVTQNIETTKQVHGFITAGDVAARGASSGAWMGGFFGLLMGAAFIWVPGIGPLFVAGPFAAALLGGIEGIVAGAAGGGLLGALFGWGISKEHILKYEEVIKGGKYLVIANGDETQVSQARTILDGLTADQRYPTAGQKVLQP